MVDIFEEVEEQLRSARYKTLALKALPWVAGVLVLALVAALAVWGVNTQREKTAAKASEAYAEALTILQAGDKAKAYAQFEAVAKAGSKPYRALALMQQAGIRVTEKRTPEAVALLDEAAKAAPSPLIGDVARLEAAYLLMDASNLLEIEGRLKPLMEKGRPYRLQAREALAMTKLANGQAAAARDDFIVLSNGLDTPGGVRQRAQIAKLLIDTGGAASLPAILKAAKAMPDTAPPQFGGGPAAPIPTTPQAGAGQ